MALQGKRTGLRPNEFGQHSGGFGVLSRHLREAVIGTTGLTGNGVTEVTEGLTAGQQLVTVGQAYLHEGDPVRVVSGEG